MVIKRSTIFRASAGSFFLMFGLLLSACAGGAGASTAGGAAAGAAVANPMSAGSLQLNEVLFSGLITAVNVDQIQMGDILIRTDGQTKFPADLKAGDSIQVRALLLPDNTRYALEIVPGVVTNASAAVSASAPADTSAFSEDIEFELYGVLQSIEGNLWTVSDQVLRMDGVRIEGSVALGSTVKIEGYVVNGVLTVKEIEVVHAGEDHSNSQSDGDQNSSSENYGHSSEDSQSEVENHSEDIKEYEVDDASHSELDSSKDDSNDSNDNEENYSQIESLSGDEQQNSNSIKDSSDSNDDHHEDGQQDEKEDEQSDD